LEIFEVTEILYYLKTILEIDERTSDVYIRGEVSNCVTSANGHTYFRLKDAGGIVDCALFKNNAIKQRHKPVNGTNYIMHGYLSVYEQQGKLQFYVDSVQPDGIGKLALEFEILKQRLEDEGLFAPERKRPLPERPRVIGVVTSPGAAAFQDILNVLRRRYPLVQVILSPTLVQGDNAPPQIVAAIQALNALPEVDVIILARGGGSIEELWAFNDERVARAVFASRLPIISGVGHEIDFTIVDFVSDMRAPTPSAAAELASPDVQDLQTAVLTLEDSLYTNFQYLLDEYSSEVSELERRLLLASPAGRITQLRQRIADALGKADRELSHRLQVNKLEISSLESRLKVLNPQQILERGYAIVTDSDSSTVISDISQIAKTTNIRVRVKNGEFEAEVK
jgi:exodeoxyribonuclease VII large subunit